MNTIILEKKNKKFSRVCTEQNDIAELRVDENSPYPPHVAISNDYIDFVSQKKIHIKRGCIKHFTETGVQLEDDTLENADFVIFCTGYQLNLNFLDKDILKTIEYDANNKFILYKSTMHPDLPNIAFVGMYKAYYAIYELQARWASEVFSGKTRLPSRHEMSIRMQDDRHLRFLPTEERRTLQDGLVLFADEIAAEIGALPDFERIEHTNSDLYKVLWEGPLSAVHFRLENADDEINSVLGEIKKEMDKPTTLLKRKFSFVDENAI